jgi:hypothetical protein
VCLLEKPASRCELWTVLSGLEYGECRAFHYSWYQHSYSLFRDSKDVDLVLFRCGWCFDSLLIRCDRLSCTDSPYVNRRVCLVATVSSATTAQVVERLSTSWCPWPKNPGSHAGMSKETSAWTRNTIPNHCHSSVYTCPRLSIIPAHSRVKLAHPPIVTCVLDRRGRGIINLTPTADLYRGIMAYQN